MAIGGGLLPPLVAELVMDVDKFSAGALKAQATTTELSASTTKMFEKVGKGASLAMAGIAVASIGMATEFDAQMTRLYTAAGAPEQAVKDATGQVLKLGDAVGFSGTKIAEALYHPVSAGLDLATSLQAVKYSAQEAQISGSSLDDTTYALSSVMKAFKVDASGAHDEMALLNSIVGQGDMRFQDFNASVANWAPTAAQMGISVQSMGAALAFLTDRGNSAESAATRVTMGLSMMATPSKQAATLLEGMGVASSDVAASSDAMTAVLKKTGITQNQLAQDLAKPDGIYVALTHLKDALDQAGIHGTEADSVLAKIFGGGRSDKAIMSLMQNLDGLKSKFDDIGAGVNKFDSDWQATQQTFSFKLKQLGADSENLAISFGNKLIPVIESTVSWFDKNQWAVGALAGAIAAVLTVSVLKYAQALTTTLITAISKTVIGIKYMGDASEEAATKQAAAAASAETWGSKLGNAIPVFGAVVAGAVALGHAINKWSTGGDKLGFTADQLETAMLTAQGAAAGLMTSVNATGQSFDEFGVKMDGSTSQMVAFGITLAKAGQMMGDASKMTKNYDAALAQMVESGNQAQAATVVAQLTAATDAQGKKMINTAAAFPQYFAALDHVKASAAESASATDGSTSAADANSIAMDQNAKSIGQAVDAGQSLTDAINSVNDAYGALTNSLTSSTALLDFRKDLLSVKDAVDKNGTAFNMNTVKGIDNMQMFDQSAQKILAYRDAQIKAAGGTQASDAAIQAANKTAADQAAQLIKVWEQVTGNKAAVDAYAKSIGLVPKDMVTTVSTPGLSAALSGLAQLNAAAGNVVGRGGSRVQTNAAGGYITGPGTGTSDSILSWLSNGEYVLSAAATAAVGRPFLDALNSGGGRGAGLGSVGGGGFSGGGGVGTPIVQVFLDGRPFAGAVRKSTLRYDLRNSGNGFSLSGTGQR